MLVRTIALFVVAGSLIGRGVGDDRPLRVAQSADFQRKQAEFDRKFEQRKREIEKQAAERKREFEKKRARTGTSGDSKHASSAPSFDVARAPSPGVSLYHFVKTARSAKSIRELFPYMPTEEVELLKERQANFDPSLVSEEKARWRERSPDLDEARIEHLTRSPYDSALYFRRNVADKILKVREVRIDGDRATVKVLIQVSDTVNGVAHPFGIATVGMVGEGTQWRYVSYEESDWVYRHEPK